MSLNEVGEFGFIDFIKSRALNLLPADVSGIGDDCAVIPVGLGRELLVTVDTLVCDRHFFKGSDPFLLGRKSLSVNISDIAAMAGKPLFCFLSIELENGMDGAYLEGFFDGFFDAAREYSVALLGGDTVSGDEFSISVTLIGENEKGTSVMRSGAEVGDDVYVTGRIGCSVAGLEAIKRDLKGVEELKMAHLNPIPRIYEAMRVKRYAKAMIDVSDGLVQDCEHICLSSGVGMEIYVERVPFCETGIVDKYTMLTGGEDYELVFCAGSEYKDRLEKMENITRIGKVIEGGGVRVIEKGKEIRLKKKGYTHF